MKNRHGHDVELSTITKVTQTDSGVEISRDPGWGMFHLSNDELDGFVPKVGDAIVTFTTGFSRIRGVIIENKVIRYATAEKVERDRQKMLDGFRLRRLDEYVEHGDALKERAKNLHPVLAARMKRFSDEGGVEFWIDSAPYEMAVLEGADALLRKTEDLFGVGHAQKRIDWIEDWWAINSDKHDPPYDYKKQMDMVPDFGEGHSGNTAGAAKFMAVAVLRGNEL